MLKGALAAVALLVKVAPGAVWKTQHTVKPFEENRTENCERGASKLSLGFGEENHLGTCPQSHA